MFAALVFLHLPQMPRFSFFFTSLRFFFLNLLLRRGRTEDSVSSVFITLFCSSDWTEGAARNFSFPCSYGIIDDRTRLKVGGRKGKRFSYSKAEEAEEERKGRKNNKKLKKKSVEKKEKRNGIKDYSTTFLLLYNCAIFRFLTELPPFKCL